MNHALDLRVVKPLTPVSNSEVQGLKTWQNALARTVAISGMRDKSLAVEIDMDAGQFSKTVSGQLGLMPDKLFRLMDACGTELPLMWLCAQRGYDVEQMKQRQSELEKKIASLEAQLKDERREREVITRFVREARAA